MRKSIHTGPQQELQRLLKAARLRAGLTQKELAARLSTPHSRVSDYERGERRLDLIQLVEYCNALETDLTSFVEEFVAVYKSLPASGGQTGSQ